MKLNSTTTIDLAKLIDSRLLVQSNSGGGKSHTLRRILEQSHGKVQQIVLDPEGEFATLREKYDYVLAGKGGDTPAEPRSAALLAIKLLELGVSAIIDLYELHPQERKHFVRLFLESMVNAPKELWHPVMVVIDEAHTFVPEKGESEAANAVIGLASLGRKRGFGAVLATQRISKLHKDAAAECNNKLIGRTGLDIDRKRAGEELGFTGKDEFLSLRTLKPGEFYAFGPAISDEVIKVQVGEVETTHPKAGSRSLTKTVPPTDKIKKILSKLSDLPAEAQKEATTAQELKQINAQLKREITTLKSRPSQPTKVEKIEVPTIGKRALEGLKKSEQALRKMVKAAKDLHMEYEDSSGNAIEILERAIEKLADQIKKVNPNKIAPKDSWLSQPFSKPISITKRDEAKPRDLSGTHEITGPEQRILDAIAWMDSIGVSEPEQTAVAFLAGYTYGGGGFNNPKGALRSKGFIEYVSGGRLKLTDDGKSMARIPDEALTTEEIHRKVLNILPGPEQRLLKPLLSVYPNDLSNEELAEASGYQVGSGGFNNPKGRLRTLGLVEYPSGGRVKARNILFLD